MSLNLLDDFLKCLPWFLLYCHNELCVLAIFNNYLINGQNNVDSDENS